MSELDPIRHHPALRESERFYSNQPGAYPVGGWGRPRAMFPR